MEVLRIWKFRKSDTGVNINLLQEYLFVPLDIFKKIQQNENRNVKIENMLEASEFQRNVWTGLWCLPEYRRGDADVFERIAGIRSEYSKADDWWYAEADRGEGWADRLPERAVESEGWAVESEGWEVKSERWGVKSERWGIKSKRWANKPTKWTDDRNEERDTTITTTIGQKYYEECQIIVSPLIKNN